MMRRLLVVWALLLCGIVCLAQEPHAQMFCMCQVGGSGAGGGGTLLLDKLSVSPLIAVSSRKLRSAYAGNALAVGNTGGGGTTNIGFTGNDLNTSLLSSTCGSNTFGIQKWFDQSGNGNDLSNSSGGNYPVVCSSGTLQEQNSHVWAVGQVNASLMNWPNLGTSQPFTFVFAAQWPSGANGASVLWGDGTNTIRLGSLVDYNPAFPTQVTAGTPDNLTHSIVFIVTGSSSKIIVDNVTLATVSPGTNGLASAPTLWNGGGNENIAEFLFFNSVLGPTDIAAIYNDATVGQKGYWGTP
jgi:hypothetical protein